MARSRYRLALLLGAALMLGSCAADNAAVPTGKDSGLFDRAPVAGAEAIANSPTAKAVRERGELVVGGSLDAPLLSQQNPITGETEGFDATLGKLLAKYILGQPKVKITNATSETREALLQNGTVDAVFQTYTITPVRAQKVLFAGPYLLSGQAIATVKGKTGITGPADLNGKTVLAGANTPGVPAIEQHAPDAEVLTFPTDPECVQALTQGRAEAYVQDLTLLAANAHKGDDLRIVGEPFTSDPYGIGLPPGDPEFKTFVNNWLKQIQDAGIWQQAWRDSLGTVMTTGPPAPPAIGSVPGS
ncbi:glutamate ABC transporter substrate-binding protein [Amycolatopsis nigrescens]|uniref:glutamate ABC transporter substrate-binding protein n=1 Tax=Amycolatopsis nigrescens TaxID=381445 RepID=UPI000364506A|nr:glutamate ABC transporter substrate-binding protein [Amycolatopsis nigrescens]